MFITESMNDVVCFSVLYTITGTAIKKPKILERQETD